MGISLFLTATNAEALYEALPEDYGPQFGLSRTFADFLFRRNVAPGEPELDQLGRLTDLDVQPLSDLLNYPDEQWLAEQLAEAESQQERRQLKREAAAAKARLAGNLGKVLALVEGLLAHLARLPNLPGLLAAGRRDTLGHAEYFADFTREAAADYLDNNLGQDLRACQRFWAFAQRHASTTVYFELL